MHRPGAQFYESTYRFIFKKPCNRAVLAVTFHMVETKRAATKSIIMMEGLRISYLNDKNIETHRINLWNFESILFMVLLKTFQRAPVRYLISRGVNKLLFSELQVSLKYFYSKLQIKICKFPFSNIKLYILNLK